MKIFIALIALFSILCSTAQASLSIGLSLLYDNNDLGSDVGFAPNLGWQLTDNDYFNHTLEAEVGFLSMDGKKGTVTYDGSTTPLLLNYRLNWNPNDVFGLYSGVGLGFSSNKMKAGSAPEESSTDFAWQFQLGTRLTFAESYNLNLGYRHLSAGEVDPDVDGGHNIIDLGFRYIF